MWLCKGCCSFFGLLEKGVHVPQVQVSSTASACAAKATKAQSTSRMQTGICYSKATC